MTTQNPATDETDTPTAHAAPKSTPDINRMVNAVSNFIDSHLWRIIAAAALAKIVAYFIAPQPPSTIGGHIGAILRGFLVFGVSISIVALIASQFSREKKRMFALTFTCLFAAASLVNLPSAYALRFAHGKANRAATDFAAASLAFEALMKYERSTFLRNEYRKTGRMRTDWLGRTVPEHEQTGRVFLRDAETEAEKYLNLSYCYATGFEDYPKDIYKAIQLCQNAASQQYLWIHDHNYHRQKAAVDTAREILTKAGLSWPEKQRGSK